MASFKSEPNLPREPPLPDLMKCAIVTDKPDNPRVLPCFHSFCEKCIQLYVENYADDTYDKSLFLPKRTFPCTACKEKTVITTTGVIGFKHDFREEEFDEILKQYTARPRINPRLEDRTKICEFCPIEKASHQASTVCTSCWRNFCETCAIKHTAMSLFSKHVFQGLNAGSGDDDISRDVCCTHSGESNEYLCLSCDRYICVKCTMGEHQHHRLSHMKIVGHSYHKNAKMFCALLQKRLKKLEFASKNLSNIKDSLMKTQKEAKRKIQRRAEELIEIVRDEEWKVLRDLKDKTSRQRKIATAIRKEIEISLVSMQQMLDFFEETVEHGHIDENILNSYDKLVLSMEELLEASFLEDMDGLETKVEFKKSSSKIKFGMLQWESPYKNGLSYFQDPEGGTPLSEVDTALHHQILIHHYQNSMPFIFEIDGSNYEEFKAPKGICFLGNGNIIVADSGNDRLQIFDASGRPIKMACKGLVRPSGIISDEKNTIFVADTLQKCITVVDNKGMVVNRIGKFLCPCGIALQKDRILVTDFFSPSLYFLDQNGRLIKQYAFRDKHDRHASGASYLAVSSNGNIIISDVSNYCVKIYSEKGKRMGKITQPFQENLNNITGSRVRNRYACPKFSPQGIAVDEKDTLFVVDGASNSVYLYSSNGTFISRIHEEKYLNGISAIALLSKPKTLALTDVCSNQIILLQQPKKS